MATISGDGKSRKSNRRKVRTSTAQPARKKKKVQRSESNEPNNVANTFSRGKKSKRRDRAASKNLTGEQAATAASLTGPRRGDKPEEESKPFFRVSSSGSDVPAFRRLAGDGAPAAGETESAGAAQSNEANLEAANEALSEHVTRNEEGQTQVDLDGFSNELANQIRDNPQLAQEILEAHPEAVEELTRQLPELEDDVAKNLYGSVIAGAEELPRGDDDEDLEALTNFITENPEAVGDPRFAQEAARRAATDGDSRLAGNVTASLDEDHPRRETISAAAQVGEHADYIADRAQGGPDQVQEAAVRLNELAGSLPPEVTAGLLEGLSQPSEPQVGPFLEPPPDDGGALGTLLDTALSATIPEANSNALIHALSQATGATNDPAVIDRVAGVMNDSINRLETPAPLAGTLSQGSRTAERLRNGFQTSIAFGGDARLGVALLDSFSDQTTLGQPSESILRDNLGASLTVGVDPLGELRSSLSAGLTNGISQFNTNFDSAAEGVSELQTDLNYLTLNYGPFMSEQELGAAVEEFRGNHEEFATFDRYANSALGNVEALDRLREVQSDLGLGEHRQASDSLAGATLNNAGRALDSPAGREQLEALIKREAHGEQTWLQDLDQRVGDSDEAQALLEKFRLTQVDVAAGSATEAAAAGQSRTAQMMLQGLEASGGLDGLPVGEAEGVVTSLSDIVDAAAMGDTSAITAAQDELGEVLDNLDMPQGAGSFAGRLASRLRFTGGALGVAGLVAQGIDVFNDPDARGVIDAAASGTGLGADLFESQLSNIFKPSSVTRVGNVAAGIGAAFSAYDAFQSFQDGDVSQGALHLAGGLGSVLALSSTAAVTGVGAVLVIGAALGSVALAQYRRVQSSNRYENGDTKNFIRHALPDNLASSEADVLSQLNNADSDGRLTGILIQQAADHLGIPPADLFDQIASLESGQIKDIVTTGHGVDPQNNEDLFSLDPDEVAEFADFLRNSYDLG